MKDDPLNKLKVRRFDGVTGINYRVRAECHLDLIRLQVALSCSEDGELLAFAWKGEPHGEGEAFFAVATLNLSQVRDCCRAVVDGHTMVETVQPVGTYTGERDGTVSLELEHPSWSGRMNAVAEAFGFVIDRYLDLAEGERGEG